MIEAKNFIKTLKTNGIKFFAGTPDSVLSDVFEEVKKEKKFYIAPHEGIAVSSGIGYYYAVKKIPCVFMQNSGLGNILNPISSIAHKKIFSVPMILVIGMRGYKGDEPQHLIQIKSTPKILRASNIDFIYLNKKKNINSQIKKAINMAKKNKMPVAILINKGTFKKNNKNKTFNKEIVKFNSYEDYILEIAKVVKKKDYLFSSTGYLHRTVFFHRNKFKTNKMFYNIGGMGHLSNIAYITAILKKDNNIYCLEGDGSFLMHLGSQTLIKKSSLKNFKYFLFNNFSHFSTGGNVHSNINNINLRLFSKSINLKYICINSSKNLRKILKKNLKGNFFIELKCNNKHIKDLPRPKLQSISF